MGVENLLYDPESWIVGDKYHPKGVAFFYAQVHPFPHSLVGIYNNNRRPVKLSLEQLDDIMHEGIDVINIDAIVMPLFIVSRLESAADEYDTMCDIRIITSQDKNDPLSIKFERFFIEARVLLSNFRDLDKARLIYLTELLDKQLPFKCDLYNFILDVELDDVEIALLRLQKYQAILEENYARVRRLDRQIARLTSAQVRG